MAVGSGQQYYGIYGFVSSAVEEYFSAPPVVLVTEFPYLRDGRRGILEALGLPNPVRNNDFAQMALGQVVVVVVVW
ncbi:uncharacterized protein ARMOST_22441 [Armillaria ostoyae]|uniref:Uncharacterized protein n=1 Tax=Armillaria ostoyae TaxID=47428 RepID=A0A284SCX0_ARMOS|nr:uncharacterized protein ARMOST_22441 [Armillaria ostoyae]